MAARVSLNGISSIEVQGKIPDQIKYSEQE